MLQYIQMINFDCENPNWQSDKDCRTFFLGVCVNMFSLQQVHHCTNYSSKRYTCSGLDPGKTMVTIVLVKLVCVSL